MDIEKLLKVETNLIEEAEESRELGCVRGEEAENAKAILNGDEDNVMGDELLHRRFRSEFLDIVYQKEEGTSKHQHCR